MANPVIQQNHAIFILFMAFPIRQNLSDYKVVRFADKTKY